MRGFVIRNAQQALPEACRLLLEHGYDQPSRNGPVRRLDTPLSLCYLEPKERVIFWEERDANPFFHLMECLWMIAGRNDVEFVSQFAKNMMSYSDNGKTFNAAYGHRWRLHFGLDQVAMIITALQKDPNCRRQVLSMWDARHDLGRASKDLPCNTQAYFQIDRTRNALDMMVCNRSNDLIWGALGSNVVHFSFLQEYMAWQIGCSVGRYWQVSFNSHIYLEQHETLMKQLALKSSSLYSQPSCPYTEGYVQATPLASLPHGRWMRELDTFLKNNISSTYDDIFLGQVVVPMYKSWLRFKSISSTRFDEAILELQAMPPECDWRLACQDWLQRRKVRASERVGSDQVSA